MAKHFKGEKDRALAAAVAPRGNVFTRFTLRSLKANRVRTVVSVIGIALSCALITAVLTSVVSLTDALIQRTAEDEGWWYAEAAGITADDLDRLQDEPGVVDWTGIADLGTVSLDEENSDLFGKYLYAKTWPTEQDSEKPLVQDPELVAGHAPEAPGEIVLPHYLQNVELAPCGLATAGGGPIKLGSKVTLDLGTRTVTSLADGVSFTMTSLRGDYIDDATQSESFSADLGQLSGTVVGFYRSYGYSATLAMVGNAAYVYDDGSALERVMTDDSDATWASVLFRTENPAEAERLADDIVNVWSRDIDGGSTVHSSLIRWMGVTPDTAIWNTLYQVAAILAAVVVVAGVSLVYNSFAISVAERTRQFGLLSSLGASRRQLRRTVLVEALVIGGVGIPVGLALGLLEHGDDAREGPRGIPVEHVARVGAHLVVARREHAVELERAVAAPAAEPHLARGDHLARGVEQLYVEHAAHVGERRAVGAHHVGAEPQRLAAEVGRVVEVEVHLLLRE